MLGVGQPASSFARGSLGVEFGGNALFELFPFFLVWLFVDGTVFGLELLAGFSYHFEFVVFETQVCVPGDFSMVAFGVVKDLAHAGRPVPVLLEKLGHGNRAGSGFSDVEGIVEHSCALGVQATQEGGSGRAADRILAKGPVESNRFPGELGKVGGGDGFVSGGGNVCVEIIADHEENVFSFGLGRFRRNHRRGAWSVDFGFLQVTLARNPLVGTILDEQVPLGVELLGLRSEFLGGEGRQPSLDLGILLFSGQVIPFVGVFFDVIEFLAVLSVANIAPVPVDDRIFSGMHMGKKNGPVFCLVRVCQGGSNGGTFQLLFGLRKSAHFPKGRI